MTSSTRFDFKFFRLFPKYRLPGKLHFTIKVSTVIFSEGGYALSRSMTTATTFSRQNVAGSREHYVVLRKSRSRTRLRI